MARMVYRVGQFWRGLSARVTPAEVRMVEGLLPPAAVRLFAEMPTDAQRHSLNVLASVRAAGFADADLAVAALLHDCGKLAAAQGGVKLGLWLRGPLVILEALLPALAARVASPVAGGGWGQGWRYALFVQREHAAIGARWAAEAGCSGLSCWMIAHHQTRLTDVPAPDMVDVMGVDTAYGLLAALQAADGGN